MHIRETTPQDEPEVAALIQTAFRPEEGAEVARLALDLLRDPTAHPLVSLAAEAAEGLVGCILFTHARIRNDRTGRTASILAPLAVHPRRQRQGVGAALVKAGLNELSARKVDWVFVFGSPDYYGRFGFLPARERGLETPHPIPDAFADAWMVKTTAETAPLAAVSNGRDLQSSVVDCAETLNHPRHWWV